MRNVNRFSSFHCFARFTRFAHVVPHVTPGLRRVDPFAYTAWAAFVTLASARMFYGYMLAQTGGEWSAPLDDVFIHFDYARATALGHPFEWVAGNGYSSGNTSLSYPFVLAVGWLVGFKGRALMVWAAMVAATSVFGILLAARRLFVERLRDTWGRASSYLLPPVFLGVGALDWSLWSGMEVSFFLAAWALALVAWQTLETDARRGTRPSRADLDAWGLGLAGALLVTTRPEAFATLAIFGLAAVDAHRRAHASAWRCLGLLSRIGLPALAALMLQALANKSFTGEWSANGAIVKLALNNPYMTGQEKLDDYVGNLVYAALRNLDYHFAHIEGEHLTELVPATWSTRNPFVYLARTAWWAGVVPVALALVPLAFSRTRRAAVVLWGQIIAWLAVVALNGQVRWQNERYVMPAVAWLLILTALGVSVALRTPSSSLSRRSAPWLSARPTFLVVVLLGALVVQLIGILTRPSGSVPTFRWPWALAIAFGGLAALAMRAWSVRAALVSLALLFAWDHQIPKMRDQKWFFGRASRNIRDQHLALGHYLGELQPRRVLVGDAGAILYESGRPGLDIIGLGGFRGLPFARAGVHGLPASLELIERLKPADRPDVLAIFPTWFGALPAWFASDVLKRFPVEGNVICGGYEHVVYRADWHLLGTGDRILRVPEGDLGVRAHVDVADLVSEGQSKYTFQRPSNGFTEMRVLPDPNDARRDIFDAGRRIKVGKAEGWTARGLSLGKAVHLVVRAVPESTTRVSVRVDDVNAGDVTIVPGLAWSEVVLEIPADRVRPSLRITLTNEGPGDFVDVHEWVTQ